MMTNIPSLQHVKPQSGFTLIEIMVGMVIALIGVVVMMNVYSNFENQKRTTTGAGDAQNNGAVSLFMMQRDIEQAGYGITTPALMGCSLILRTGVTLPLLAPVVINPSSAVVPAGDANTDTLLAFYGNPTGQTDGHLITTAGPVGMTTATNWDVATPSSFTVNDLVIATPFPRPSPCSLAVDTVVGVNSTTVITANGQAAANFAKSTNVGTLFNLGNNVNGNMYHVAAYAIRNGNLTMCDYVVNTCGDPTMVTNTAVWMSIGNNIVSMKAQYGRDDSTVNPSPMNGIVNLFDNVTPAATAGCEWARIESVRLALVARNTQPNKLSVTPTPPVWFGSVVAPAGFPPGNVADPIDLTGTNASLLSGTSWANYRYKVFQTTIPLRNMVMKGAPSGC